MNETEKIRNPSDWYTPHANMRTDCYALLAALLNKVPDQDMIALLQKVQWQEDMAPGMQERLTSLSRASHGCSPDNAASEFHRLFVGLGSGEMVPYSSWYREKMIQSRPLAAIRTDLRQLQIVRRSDAHEPEDHAGALCEIMALISQEESGIPLTVQADFFTDHVEPWMTTFFNDLEAAESAEFYRTVGSFGACFLETERDYLKHRIHDHNFQDQGGKQHDS